MGPFAELVRALVTALALTAGLLGQHQFMPSFGAVVPLTVGTMATVNLGFNFTMPGGAIVSSVAVDQYGRIAAPGTTSSMNSPNPNVLASGPATIVPWWSAFNAITHCQNPNCDLYFGTDNASVAWISWVNAGHLNPCTFQCQLHADGRIVMVYDSRCIPDYGIVALTPGGTTLPTATDLSAASSGALGVASLVFEDFSVPGAPFDLQSTALEFTPNGSGGSNGWVIAASSVDDSNPPFATIEKHAGGCHYKVSFEFTPDGSSGYDVQRLPSMYDSDVGTHSGATRAGLITAVGMDLTFPFTFPGGTRTSAVDIDPFGRILPAGVATHGDFTPSVVELTTAGYPMICCWTDWNITEPHSDAIYFKTVPGQVALFTWRDVAQYNNSFMDFPALTFQIALYPDNRIVITLEDFAYFNQVGHSNDDDLLIGIASGFGGGVPPEVDLFGAHTPVNSAVPVYEFWDASHGVEPVDFVLGQPFLAADAPAMGASWNLSIRSSPLFANLEMVLLGFQPTNVPGWPTYQNPCGQYVIPAAYEPGASVQVAIPNDPAFMGVHLYAQGLTNAAYPWFGLPFFLTNAVRGRIGT